ncbi:MAG: hypothetical protein EXQ99_01240 [Alphaproteobacteria bacterium]|nr:hypothetical protein [Alphaproteobacteria bacterium]
MRLQFVPCSGTRLDAEFRGHHQFSLFLDSADIAVPGPDGRWMLGVDGEIVSGFGGLNQAKHAAEQFAMCLALGPGLSGLEENFDSRI